MTNRQKAEPESGTGNAGSRGERAGPPKRAPRTIPTIDQSGMSRSERRNEDRTTRVIEEAMTQAGRDHELAQANLRETAIEALEAAKSAIRSGATADRPLQLMDRARRQLDAADQIRRAYGQGHGPKPSHHQDSR